MQSQIIKLNKPLNKYLKEREISDIIIFGSVMKGKHKPKDIDLLIIFKEKINKELELKIRRELDNNYEINSITEKELINNTFTAKEGIYLEGYSFSKKSTLADSLNFFSMAYLKYDIKNLKGSNRIKFYYALMGRNNKNGFLTKINATRFSDNVITCDYLEIEKLKDFFDSWNINYEVFPALIPKRLKHILLKQ